ncbi:unnamed protein product [Oikopleura dioica]|uniref:Uncharacterized protein n=1 Tax=Oikopleura dioica TaxID=34765 RepID=E4XHN3_OIKDI|nr:unnamed protein product [Oikopleura dioica]
MHLCCICAEKARKTAGSKTTKSVEFSLPGDEKIPTAFVKVKKLGDERECNFHYENELIPELYKYYCSDCAAVKLLRDPSIKESDHVFVNERVREEEPCTNYRLWLQFTALVNEMLRRKHHFMAQHSIILSSRETFLNALETFVKTHIQLPLTLRDYRRDRAMLQKYVNNKFEFGQTPRRAKEDLETIEMLRARPVIDEDENFIQISQMLIGKTRMETIPLSASAFAYFFYKSEMEMIMELALQKCTDKITYWDKKIEKWIEKRTRYFSVHYLPAHVGPKVIPFQAYHVWYTKIPAKNVCPVEEYQQKSLESWHASSTNNQIKAFVERYMSTRGNHEIKINYAHKSRCPILRAVCNYGDVVVRNPHGEKQVTLASWWSGIQTKQAVDRSPGKNREVKGAQKQRQNQLCAFSKNVMLDKFSAILHKPSVNTLKQSGVMLWRAVIKFPGYRRVMRILLKYLNEDEKTRDHKSMLLEIMSLKQVEERRTKDKNYPDRFPKVTKNEMVEFLTSARALANNFAMPYEQMGNILIQKIALNIKREKDEEKKNFYPTILMNMLNCLKILDNSVFIDQSSDPKKRSVRRRNIRFTYRKAFNATHRNRNKRNGNRQTNQTETSNTDAHVADTETQLTEEEREKQAIIEKFKKDDFKEMQIVGNKQIFLLFIIAVVKLNGNMLNMKESEEYLRARRAALSTKKKEHVVISKEDLELEETEESNRAETERLELSTMLNDVFTA